MDTKKTALVLSGGGSRGAYEVGVWQALRYMGIKPDMVYGTSVGSINGAMVVQDKLDLAVSLWKELETDMIFDINLTEGRQSNSGLKEFLEKSFPDFKEKKGLLSRTPKAKKTAAKANDLFDKIEIAGFSLNEMQAYAKEILTNGGAGNTGLRKLLEKYVDETAIRNSKVEYGLTTVEIPTFTPHHLYINDIPKGLLHDYILASSAVFPAIKAQEINGKKFIDGGFADVMPINMAIKRGASHIICVYLDALGVKQEAKLQEDSSSPEEIITIESKWDLGNVLTFDKQNAARLINLGFLDALKTYDILQGEYYTFPRGEFDKKTLRDADAAAKVFELNPEIIYKRDNLNKILKEEIEKLKKYTDVPSWKEIPKDMSLRKAFFKEKAQDHLAIFKEGLLDSVLAIAIAQGMKDYPEVSEFFTRRGIKNINSDHVSCAHYLLKAGLV